MKKHTPSSAQKPASDDISCPSGQNVPFSCEQKPQAAPPRRGRPKDPAKREAILEAAKALFLERGFEGTSMEAVAAQAKVSKLTLYSHFSGKQALFQAMVSSKLERHLGDALFEQAARLPVREGLIAIGRAFASMINSDDSLCCLRIAVSGDCQGSEFNELFFESGPVRVQRSIVEYLRLKTAAGELDIAEEDFIMAAEQFLGSLHHFNYYRRIYGIIGEMDEAELSHLVHGAVRLFLRGYGSASVQ